MSQYPVVTEEGLYEGVNYLLSGPGGLGQNFQGFSSYTTAYVTGNYRTPYTNTTGASLYVPAITLSDAQALDDYTVKFTFSSTQATVPFALGNGITIDGVDPSDYNGTYNPVGVVECTTDYVIVRTSSPYTYGAYVSGGNASYYNTSLAPDQYSAISTDCNARVIVTGGTDRVFISAQLNNLISYTTSGTSDLNYTVRINRYIGEITSDPVNPDYRFNFDATISEKIYTIPALTGTGVVPEIETIFSTVVDRPAPSYYWYILELYFQRTASDLQVTECAVNLRSLSAQVVKQ